jgi:hypothetical protein
VIGAISWLDSARFTNATPALLHKALDRQHRGALNQFRRAKDAAGVLSLWQETAKRGNIPGAYWAAITHPAATDHVIKRIFAKVHMLRTSSGAANRADIQKLRQLEEQHAALVETIDRQQQHLRDARFLPATMQCDA